MKPAPRRILLLGSGALKIGEAGEFDYSGSQALKALREAGVHTVLVNPNIATVQTSDELCDRLYALPLDPDILEPIIEKEKIDGLLLSFGGQTALNCGLALEARGVLARHGVTVLGTPTEAIRQTEDRKLFNDRLASLGVSVARGQTASSLAEAKRIAQSIGLPVMLRGAFALGGRGSSIVERPEDLDAAIERIFAAGISQVLVEEALVGYKEIELEIVRDAADNCICVCSMENVDPLGIHTGDSIVVAPCQTLTNHELQSLRSIAFRVVRAFGIVGECNIQFALAPDRWDYRVIEVNARLSRSSALASKATGYPLAYVAAKLCLGATLDQIGNPVTGTTPAFFEPALDYITCKVPRWDLDKFLGAETRIGSEMKSIGETMAIGRSFPEVLQKALRMLDIGVLGLDPNAFEFADLEAELRRPSQRRIFAIARALADGLSLDRVHELTRIDRFFLHELDRVVRATLDDSPWQDRLRGLKELGFSDEQIGKRWGPSETAVREERHAQGVSPSLLQIDTLAAEYPATTRYSYLTYGARHDDLALPSSRSVLILGSGPYRIGSSVEFDWCCVQAALAAREAGIQTVLLNCNPETVSTDYDRSDLLVFDEVSNEVVLELLRKRPSATGPIEVVVSMGGQRPNTLAPALAASGVPICGTPPESVDQAEDRSKFSRLCDHLDIDQPLWTMVTDEGHLDAEIERLGGYPVIVRPSYVLSGAAMSVVHHASHLRALLARAARISPEYPVVISRFESNAREFDIDAVADRGELLLWAACEHIENAGIHSGDATLVLPPQRLYMETLRRAHRITRRLARELRITGPFNVQFLARHNDVKVIECNLRASRSFPFVSKMTGNNFAREAMRRMLGLGGPVTNKAFDIERVGVKASQFSFGRLAGADPFLGVEMRSTGEVACIGQDLHEALLKALWATGLRRPLKGVLLSLGPYQEKYRFEEEARLLAGMGLKLFATSGTATILGEAGITCATVGRTGEANFPSAVAKLDDGSIDLVVNVPRMFDEHGRPDGSEIRRRAVDRGIPLITDIDLARLFVQAMARHSDASLAARPATWNELLAIPSDGRSTPGDVIPV